MSLKISEFQFLQFSFRCISGTTRQYDIFYERQILLILFLFGDFCLILAKSFQSVWDSSLNTHVFVLWPRRILISQLQLLLFNISSYGLGESGSYQPSKIEGIYFILNRYYINNDKLGDSLCRCLPRRCATCRWRGYGDVETSEQLRGEEYASCCN